MGKHTTRDATYRALLTPSWSLRYSKNEQKNVRELFHIYASICTPPRSECSVLAIITSIDAICVGTVFYLKKCALKCVNFNKAF